MSLFDALTGPVCQRLTWTLLHFLWQAAAVAILLLAVLWLLRVRRARIRYALSAAALLVTASCPVVTFGILGGPESRPAAGRRAQPLPPSHFATPREPAPERPERESLPVAEAAPATVPEAMPVSGAVTWPATLADRIRRLQPHLLFGWIAGVALLSGRLLMSVAGGFWLRRGRRPIAKPLADRAAGLARKLGLTPGRADWVFVSEKVREALVVGLLRPMVLLPAAWLAETPPEVLEAVIAHELAHIRRWDLWVNLLQRLVETLLFYHPAVWWLSHRVRLEREMCCDEMAVAATGRRAAYASALEQLARKRLVAKQPALASTIGGGKMALLKRVRNVLGLSPRGGRVRGWMVGLAAALVLVWIWRAAVSTPTPLVTQAGAAEAARSSASAEGAGGEEAQTEGPDREVREVLRLGGQASAAWREKSRDNLKQLGLAMHNFSASAALREKSRDNLKQLGLAMHNFSASAAWREKSRDNLKQLGLAMHNFYDVYGHFPPAAVRGGRGGRAVHSWRVAVLPFVEAAPLYEQYNFDEPWDSPANLKVLEQMPEAYRHPGDDPDSTNTAYFVVTGPTTVFYNEAGARFSDVRDGTSYTLLAVEAKRNVPWTKPEDIPYDASKPLPKLGGFYPDGFHVLQCDGAANFVKVPVHERFLRAALTRAGQDRVGRELFGLPEPGKLEPGVAISPTERALALIAELGGRVEVDETRSGRPVVAVSLYGQEVDNDVFRELEALTELERLSVRGTRVGWGLSQVAKLSKLKELRLGEVSPDAYLRQLEDMTGLETLRISGTWVSDQGLAHLHKLSNLKVLGLSNTRASDVGLESLKDMTRLETLELVNTRVTGTGLKHLQSATGLRSLKLGNNPQVTDQSLQSLRGLPSLETLDLWGDTQVTGAFLKDLGGLARLHTLTLRGSGACDAGLAHIGAVRNLEVVSLGRTELTDAGLEHLKGLARLRSLSLAVTPVTDAGLKALAGMTSLEELDLAGNSQITDAGLAHLQALPKLRSLDLASTGISDAGLKALAGMASLEALDLGQNSQITDAGVETLRQMTGLEELNLSRTGITYESIQKLWDALGDTTVRY